MIECLKVIYQLLSKLVGFAVSPHSEERGLRGQLCAEEEFERRSRFAGIGDAVGVDEESVGLSFCSKNFL